MTAPASGRSRSRPVATCRRRNLRILACGGRRTTAAFARGVLCTFWPQKVPKTPRRMPLPTSSRLTFETGARLKGGFKGRWAAERVISDTTLSLLKPASYAGTFSRDFVSRLRHRAGIVRRETRREGCVRDKQEAQQPTIAPGSGFKPPHYRLDGKRTTESPRARSGRLHSLVLAAPAQRGREVVPAKATCGWFWCYLLPPKGSYTPRHSPRFCLFGRAKKRTREQRMFAPVRVFACSRRTGRRTGRRAGRSCQPQCESRFLTGQRAS